MVAYDMDGSNELSSRHGKYIFKQFILTNKP
jgi:hypothetical protein